jgi:hypothetical protein
MPRHEGNKTFAAGQNTIGFVHAMSTRIPRVVIADPRFAAADIRE